MIEAYGPAIATLFDPVNLLIITVAIVFGLIIGVIPTIGGLVSMPLVLVFIMGMPAEVALIILVGYHAVIYTGGSITAILLNIPGTAPNAATMIDGFPMTQKGEGGRAIGAAVMSSMAGGAMPVFFALLMIPLVLPILLSFGQPEMAALVLVGIAFLASLTGESVGKGIIGGMLGLLLSLIGYHQVTGVFRFSPEATFLYDGIELIPLTLGLFGIAELFHLLMRGQTTITQKAMGTKFADVLRGVKDVWIHKWLWFRSSLIGYVIGIIPGIGGDVAMFVAYGQAKQTSKHPEEFGTGRVEGVIGPESANNAKEAGALLTTMSFGIPGSAVMGMMLAAFMMVGITPGPSMLVEHLPLALTLLLGIALANIIGGVICLFTTPYLVKVASLHMDYIFTGVLMVALAGVFVATLSMGQFIVAFIFGILGLVMRRHGYSRPALLLGFLLGGMLENYTTVSYKLSGPLFFVTPISLGLIAILVLVLFYPNLSKALPRLKRRFKKS